MIRVGPCQTQDSHHLNSVMKENFEIDTKAAVGSSQIQGNDKGM